MQLHFGHFFNILLDAQQVKFRLFCSNLLIALRMHFASRERRAFQTPIENPSFRPTLKMKNWKEPQMLKKMWSMKMIQDKNIYRRAHLEKSVGSASQRWRSFIASSSARGDKTWPRSLPRARTYRGTEGNRVHLPRPGTCHWSDRVGARLFGGGGVVGQRGSARARAMHRWTLAGESGALYVGLRRCIWVGAHTAHCCVRMYLLWSFGGRERRAARQWPWRRRGRTERNATFYFAPRRTGATPVGLAAWNATFFPFENHGAFRLSRAASVR